MQCFTRTSNIFVAGYVVITYHETRDVSTRMAGSTASYRFERLLMAVNSGVARGVHVGSQAPSPCTSAPMHNSK